jgi:hypothetical protein
MGNKMKVLSLEEINLLDFQVPAEVFDVVMRLEHTAREYHRLREALEFYADENNWRRILEHPAGKRAREALKKSEGE